MSLTTAPQETILLSSKLKNILFASYVYWLSLNGAIFLNISVETSELVVTNELLLLIKNSLANDVKSGSKSSLSLQYLYDVSAV